MPSLKEQTNADWLGDLRGSGQRHREACESLRAVLIRRLGRALGARSVDPATIEDFAQEGLVRVLQGLESFRGDSKFTTWATAVALRSAYTELRRARWKDRNLDELGVDQWPADAAPTAEDELEKRSLIASMPTKEQIAALGRLAMNTRPAEITCDELLDRVARYAEIVFAGKPVPPELRPVADHLRVCVECTEELEALRKALVEG